MKHSKQSLGLALFLGGALVFSACNNQQADSKQLAEETNEEMFDTRAGEMNAEIMVEAVNANNTEVNLAQLAARKAGNAEVKDIAASLESEHTTMLNELKALAASKAITVPVEMSEASKDDYKDLDEAAPADFDKKWCKEMMDRHDETIRVYENALRSDLTDQEIRTWIENALPKLRTHQEQLKIAHDKLK